MISFVKHFGRILDPKVPIEYIVLADGKCPICNFEISWLSKRCQARKENGIIFYDFTLATEKNEGNENPATEIVRRHYQLESSFDDYQKLMDSIHGIRVNENEKIEAGVDVFVEMYSRAGLGWLLTPASWRFTRPILDFGYKIFRSLRIPLSFRSKEMLEMKKSYECRGACQIPSKKYRT